MNIDEKRELLFKELKDDIALWGSVVAERVSGKRELPKTGDIEGYQRLRECLESDEDIEALQKVVADACQGLVHSFLCMFDGVTLINDYFIPGIIDMRTNENLAPEEIAYHDSFYRYLSEHEDA